MERTEADVIVVGSGCAGMVAALTAKSLGLDTVIIEKAPLFGGTTAISGGGAWIPNAPVKLRQGFPDDEAEVDAYLENIAGDSVSASRRRRFVRAAPRMMAFLEGISPHLNDAFFWVRGFSDYKPALGGSPDGRGVWPKPIDATALGDEQSRLRGGWARIKGVPEGMWITARDLNEVVSIRWKGSGLKPYRALIRLLWRTLRSRVLGEQIVVNGAALITRLRLALRDVDVPLLLETPMVGLETNEAGRVVAVRIERNGVIETIHARHGVVLASGGFERNAQMRQQYQPFLAGPGWSIASPDNTGDGQRAAEAVGASLELMDECWWYPVFQLPHGLSGLQTERKLAGQFIVNSAGERFGNEASDYNSFGQLLVTQNRGKASQEPAWMIIDDDSWRHNIICGHFPFGPVPAEWIRSGLVKTAGTIDELAAQMGVASDTLRSTMDRFNRFARAGKDEQFCRGESAYDNYMSDPSRKNPNLAEVKRPPYYAFQIYPGDLGTRGGVATDEDGRALRADGSVIPGLYAAGNASAAVMGRSYAGAGSTIGPAMTFAWLAARRIAAESGLPVSAESFA